MEKKRVCVHDHNIVRSAAASRWLSPGSVRGGCLKIGITAERTTIASWWDLFNQVVDTYPDEFSVEQLIDTSFAIFNC